MLKLKVDYSYARSKEGFNSDTDFIQTSSLFGSGIGLSIFFDGKNKD
ncbi:MAG: hypothetical protein AAFZ15_33550 [Bacteroidota bacterium]